MISQLISKLIVSFISDIFFRRKEQLTGNSLGLLKLKLNSTSLLLSNFPKSLFSIEPLMMNL